MLGLSMIDSVEDVALLRERERKPDSPQRPRGYEGAFRVGGLGSKRGQKNAPGSV